MLTSHNKMMSVLAFASFLIALVHVQAADVLSARYDHTLTPLTHDASSFLLFGGMATNMSEAAVPFPAYTFDNRQLQFSKLSDANSQPAMMQDAGHLAELVHDDSNGPVVLYLSGLLYTYSPSGVWTQISAPGITPTARASAKGTTNGAGIMYMLGNGSPTDTLWALDYDSKSWSSIALPAGLSGSIVGHGMAFANGQLFVMGGMISGVYNTKLFVFNAAAGTWAEPIELGNDAARSHFSLTVVGNTYLVLIGGQTALLPDGSSDILIYDIASQTLKSVAVSGNVVMTPRYGHSAYWDPIRSVVSVWGGSSAASGALSNAAQIQALSSPIGLAGILPNNGHYLWYNLAACSRGDCSGDYLVPGQPSPASIEARHQRQLALLIVLIIVAVLFVAFIVYVILAKRGIVKQPSWLAGKVPVAVRHAGQSMMAGMTKITGKGKQNAAIKSEDAATVADAASQRRGLPAVPIPAQSAVLSDTSSHHSNFDMSMLQSPAVLDEYEEIALEEMPSTVNTSFRTLAEVNEPETGSLKRTVSTKSRASSISVESVQDYGESNQSSIHARSRALSALGPFRMVSVRRDSVGAEAPREADIDMVTQQGVPEQEITTERPASTTASVITVLHEEEHASVHSSARSTSSSEASMHEKQKDVATTEEEPTVQKPKSMIESTMLDELLHDLSKDVSLETEIVDDQENTLDNFLQHFEAQKRDATIYESTSTMATMLTVPDLQQAVSDIDEVKPEAALEGEEEGDIDWNIVPAIQEASLPVAPTHLPLPPSPIESSYSDYSNTLSEASSIKWTRVDGSIDPPRPEDAFKNLMAQLEARNRHSQAE